MSALLEPVERDPLVLHTTPAVDMDDDQFFELCRINPNLRLERSGERELIIMAPTGGSSSSGNSELNYQFKHWARRDGTGTVFDSSGGFTLPNGAIRSPDVSWVRNERLAVLTDEQWEKFLPFCPDFVLELRSPADPLRRLEQKMEEYMQNGARLGWLLDPEARRVHVYRPAVEVEIVENPATHSGAPVLAEFTLEIAPIWAAIQRKR